MGLVPIFHGEVTATGQLVFPEHERPLRQSHLRGLAGKKVEVVVRKERVQRSLDMNAYLHAQPFPILAEHFGYTIPEVKLVLMGECFGWKHDKIAGREVPIKPSTSEMTVEESAYFVDWVIPWAMTNYGVDIPLPKETEEG